MKKTDLRIGNYLLDANDRLCKVEIITSKKDYAGDVYFKAPAIEGAVTTLPNKPIPLTEEWILKLGFKNTGIKWMDKSVSESVFMKKDKYYLELIECECEWYFNLFFGMMHDPCHLTAIRYVHQLQNLYFALTGVELTYE